MRVTAVIGANFGDEGKGLLTDYLCADRPRSVTIRFNGGAQAGHTVVTPEGRCHTFSHFGSGTLAGADTYLSRFFLLNPVLWASEFRALGKPPLRVHPEARLSTPFDMLFNRALERSRGNSRHGSCGFGIFETDLRCRGSARTTVLDLYHRNLGAKLRAIAEYFEVRAQTLGVQLDWNVAHICDEFTAVARDFIRHAVLAENVGRYWNVVFEGAQGLLLDEGNKEYFPYVTGSRTGLANVKELCQELNLGNDLEAIYVTRSYMTRHGAGPFPTEEPGLSFPDSTNVPNEWQGTLRFGNLDASLSERIHRDAALMGLLPSLAVTCTDQRAAPEELQATYISAGPTRAHVSIIEAAALR